MASIFYATSPSVILTTVCDKVNEANFVTETGSSDSLTNHGFLINNEFEMFPEIKYCMWLC